VPVGTVRLVPPPHKAHDDGIEEHTEKKDTPQDTPTPASDPEPTAEPYIKLGRLAVLKPYRRLKLSSLLVNSALAWAEDNAASILPPPAPANVEKNRLHGAPEQQLWRGLVLVHAQKVPHVIKVWERWGFVKDESMDTWIEEGIEHVGLWKRIQVGE
jgi:GNAT superfamily N-acetyltransferase